MTQNQPIDAEPYEFAFDPAHCALVIIDMQRDFLEPGGFGAMLGNDVSQLRRAIEPNLKLLTAWRAAGLLAIHTREGHRPDMADLSTAKKIRGGGPTSIGDKGPMGRILIRGEAGHDIIPELYPAPCEPIIDKPARAPSTPPTCTPSCSTAASPNWSSPASPRKSASIPPSARPTIAATTACASRIAAPPTSPNSTNSA